MIVLLGHSGCFVPVMRFRVAVPTVPVFSVYRGSLPLAFCFVPVMRFCVAVPTVPVFSVYPRQFAFGFLFCPYHAVSCCRTDDSGFFSLSAAVCLWLFVSSRSCRLRYRTDDSGFFSLSAAVCLWCFGGFLPPILSSAASPYNAEEKRRIYELPAAFPCSARQ